MQYLKCVGIFMLVHLLIVANKWLMKIQDESISNIAKIVLTFIGYLVGGLWFFIFLKIFGFEILGG